MMKVADHVPRVEESLARFLTAINASGEMQKDSKLLCWWCERLFALDAKRDLLLVIALSPLFAASLLYLSDLIFGNNVRE
jgi:hypothetical protein